MTAEFDSMMAVVPVVSQSVAGPSCGGWEVREVPFVQAIVSWSIV